jgi:uncharacterized membrane protein YedE/YeeE
MNSFILALIGGGLVGLASSLLLYSHGKVAGISGILGGFLVGGSEDKPWRLSFLIGLIMAGMIYVFIDSSAFINAQIQAPWITILAGLLVGFGTQLGNGCTSGHGICGLARGSKRSFTATMTFMLTGMIAAFIIQHFIK